MKPANTVAGYSRAWALFGVRAAPKNARDRLLNTAIDLFYVHGFHLIGLDRILEETHVTKTTFYKYFESKDDLVVAAIERRDEWEAKAWARAIKIRGGSDPVKQLLALFDVLDMWFNSEDYGGCLFINAAVAFPDPKDPAHKAAALHKTKTRDFFRDLARKAGSPTAEIFADLYTAVFEGTLILRHVHHRDDAARLALPLVQKLIEAHMPGEKAGSS
jgi:AcrR family transcriptional regulator